jgi:hypothetical protein
MSAAWYEFFPDYASYFDGIDFHPGDTIQLSAKVTTDYTTSMSTGTVIVHNNSTGHTVKCTEYRYVKSSKR